MSVAFFERERNATLLHGVRKADPTAQGQRTGTLGSGSGRRVSQSGGGNCHIEWPGSCLHDARCSGTILSFYFRPASVLHFPAKSPARLLPKHTTGQREDCRIDVLLPRGWCVGDRGGGGQYPGLASEWLWVSREVLQGCVFHEFYLFIFNSLSHFLFLSYV